MKSLMLGTAQLGMPYGIANTSGQPQQETATHIVQIALDNGVTWFDTAQDYGMSEIVLGKCLAQITKNISTHIISKLSIVLAERDAEKILPKVKSSLARLGVPRLACLMFHREEHLDFLQNIEFADAFASIKNLHLADTLGCSVYTPQKALDALAHPLIDTVQIPANLFDRRFEYAGVFTAAARQNKTIHVRSAFLQGVLCMPVATLPQCLKPLEPYLEKFHILCTQYGLAPANVAMAWVLRRYPQARIIFGAESPEQVEENARSTQNMVMPEQLYVALTNLRPPQDATLLNPSLWSK